MFSGIIDNWRKDAQERPLLFWLEMLGTLGCIVAAGTLALTAPHPNLIHVYSAYLVGSTSLAITSYWRKNGFWVLLNLFFMTVDLIGLTNTILG